MMMRFTKVTEDMREAMLQFCMEQSEMNGYTSEDEVMALVDSAFDVFDKASKTALPVVPVYRYHMYAGEQYTDEILPESIRENGVIYDRAVQLGTFMLDSYSADTEEAKAIIRGYDVIYDLDSEEIKLLYRVMTADDSVTTLYRVDTDLYEDFDVYEFMIDISAQIIGKLKQSLSVLMTFTIKEAA